MIGPEGAAELIRADLEARYPVKLAELAARLGVPVDDPTVRVPAFVDAREVVNLSIDDYPAVFVVVGNVSRVEALEVGATVAVPDDPEGRHRLFGDLYRFHYGVRVFTWARGQRETDTDLARKRLLLATRELVLTGLEAGAVDAASYTESLSDVAADDEQSITVAAAFASFTAAVDEVLEPPAGGEVGTIDTFTPTIHPADL